MRRLLPAIMGAAAALVVAAPAAANPATYVPLHYQKSGEAIYFASGTTEASIPATSPVFDLNGADDLVIILRTGGVGANATWVLALQINPYPSVTGDNGTENWVTVTDGTITRNTSGISTLRVPAGWLGGNRARLLLTRTSGNGKAYVWCYAWRP